MVGVTTIYQGVLVVAGAACLGLASYGWYMEGSRGQREVIGLFLAIVTWIALALTITLAAGTDLVRPLAKLQLFGMTLVPPLALLAAFLYTGKETYINRWSVGFLLAQPVAAAVMFSLPSFSREVVRFGARDPTAYYGFAVSYGWLVYAHAVWAYLILALATGLFLEFAVRSHGVYRRQAGAVVASILVPWAGNVLFLFGPVSVDLTPIGFTLTGFIVWWAIVEEDLFDVMPVALDPIIENVDAGLLVVDWQDRIVEANPEGLSLLGLGDQSVIGEEITDLLSHERPLQWAVAEACTADEDTETEVELSDRDLLVTSSRLSDDQDNYIGRLVLLEDITDQKRRQRQLERQNERLEEFASVVSHDLRNPLSVATGRLEIAEQAEDPQTHIEHANEALDRMDAIIDDVLALARGGQQVRSPERVSLSSIAHRAWDSVDADAATLTVTDDGTVVADADRLQRALENLFRNAIEHGSTSPPSQAQEDAVEHSSTSPDSQARQDAAGTSSGEPSVADAPEDATEHGPEDVTITVGTTDDGFYVADDGPGVPESDRDRIFKHGYSTSDQGTGFGLPIVRDIVEAHGWTIDVTESETGGARFEVTDVEVSAAA